MKRRYLDGTVDFPVNVYAYLDAEGRYLYIGQAWDLREREREHRRTSPWFAEAVERVILLQTLYRRSAVKAEARAIEEHRPLHNVMHNPDARKKQSA